MFLSPLSFLGLLISFEYKKQSALGKSSNFCTIDISVKFLAESTILESIAVFLFSCVLVKQP